MVARLGRDQLVRATVGRRLPVDAGSPAEHLGVVPALHDGVEAVIRGVRKSEPLADRSQRTCAWIPPAARVHHRPEKSTARSRAGQMRLFYGFFLLVVIAQKGGVGHSPGIVDWQWNRG